MNLFKFAVLVALIALGIVAWKNIPALRTKAQDQIEKWQSWSEDDIKKDPTGYIEHVEDKLSADINNFEEQRDSLLAVKQDAQTKHDEAKNIVDKADKFANQFKTAYQTAEADGQWPVTVGDSQYSKEQLMTQVKSVLTEKATYSSTMKTYSTAITQVDKKVGDLRTLVQESKAQLTKLAADKSLLKAGEMTSEASDMIAKVNKVVDINLNELTAFEKDPIKSLEDLVKADDAATAKAAVEKDVMDFLTGG